MRGEFRCHICAKFFDNGSDLQKNLTSVHGQVSKACTVRELQSCSVTLARSGFRMPAILTVTSFHHHIHDLTNCQKQNARDLQRQLVLQVTSGEFFQVSLFQVALENSASVVVILHI